MICSQSDSLNLLIASRSPASTDWNGSFSFHSGCCGAISPRRFSANIACAYIGCSVQSVPSWSNVATRSWGSMYLELDFSVVSFTNVRIASFAGPLFHDGKGSLWACAPSVPSNTRHSASAALAIQRRRTVTCSMKSPLCLDCLTARSKFVAIVRLRLKLHQQPCKAHLVGGSREPPTCRQLLLIAGAFGRRLRFGHPLRHLGLNCVKVKARASLHRRELNKGLEFLGHQLLDENETPELVLEPVEVLLSTFLGPVIRPAGTLERI